MRDRNHKEPTMTTTEKAQSLNEAISDAADAAADLEANGLALQAAEAREFGRQAAAALAKLEAPALDATPDLTGYDWILVNSSAGKDSQTALRQVVLEADRQGVSRDRIVVAHQDLGQTVNGNDYEWRGVLDLAREQAEFYGLRFVVTARRQADGSSDDILSYVRRRGAWPSNTVRFCTSEFKRSPGARVVTMLDREVRTSRAQHVRILVVFGFRAQESTARSKRAPFEVAARMTTKSRTVHNWLPIHSWTADQVWADIKASGVRHHEAYDLGMPRLSCCFCIFAPASALEIAGRHNPELLAEYVQVEQEIGHTFRNGFAIGEVADAIAKGTAAQAGDAVDDWCCG
jgi:3'-phosphoadenosine 5'-phosphosulfate sulfotransferase (PAPS reductase)/FAD synthetase